MRLFRYASSGKRPSRSTRSIGAAVTRWVARATFTLLLPVTAYAQSQATQPKTIGPAPTTKSPVAFTGVTVVDVDQGKLIPHQTVVITGTRITSIGKTGDVKVPAGATVADARGKYLIPGLWDAHVHVWGYPNIYYPLFIANGITGVREMSEPGNGLDSMLQWRREIVAGTRIGPRIIGTGGTIFSTEHPGEIAVRTIEEGRRAVDSLKAAGADFVKFHEDDMAREIYFAMVAHAKEVGMPLDGHLPNTINEIEASDAGQRTVEHFNEIHCWWPANAWPPSTFPAPDSAGIKRCIDVAAAFARNHTYFVPTLVLSKLLFDSLPDYSRYWPAPVREESRSVRESGWGEADPTLERGLEIVRLLHQHGTPLLAGTDAAPILASIAPGFALHEELATLVQAGLSPLDALRSATLNPAKAFGAADSLGTIAPDKLADLVLLDADPLADIHNTKKISSVMANGHYYNRAALDSLLTEVERNSR